MARITKREREEFHQLLDFSIRKLENPKNINKKHWGKLPLNMLQKMLAIESAELDLAVNHGGVKDIIDECDDIINFAMFIKHNIMTNFNMSQIIGNEEVK